ncbi:MAG: 2-phospho-L-lactate transferase [Candidatus Binatia bacterium]
MMLAVLTGGTGGAKLIQGLSLEIDPKELFIIVNTADDLELHGLHISPDLDTIMYTLAGIVDPSKGWGIKDDTFVALESLERYGAETWFRLGDRDLATHLSRSRLLRQGDSLSAITRRLCSALGVDAWLTPMSDDRIQTLLETPEGEISFQEYFVKRRWAPEVTRVTYAGAEASRPAAGILETIGKASAVIFCPSNPVTSIGPILSVPGIRSALQETEAKIIGVSPIVQSAAFSGPTTKLMEAVGIEPSSYGVALGYADLLDEIVIAEEDKPLKRRIQSLDVAVLPAHIRMDSLEDKRRLAREVLALT